jgi:hypothetical protein
MIVKKLLPLWLCCLANGLQAQETVRYYDLNWKECLPADACFVGKVKRQGDLWEKDDFYTSTGSSQMYGTYRDSSCKIKHGRFAWYYANKQVKETGAYVDGKREGTWLTYHHNGMMKDSTAYRNGSWEGIFLGWHPNGNMKDSATKLANGLSSHVHWFDNGNLSAAGYRLNGKLHKTWRFYHSNGQLAAEEAYDQGQLVKSAYFTETGEPQTDTSNINRAALFGQQKGDWLKYMYKKAYFPKGFQIVNGTKVIAIVVGTVNESGEVEDAYLEIPIHPRFDGIVLNAVKKSPKWTPAISHNRRVKDYFRQLFTFQQNQE